MHLILLAAGIGEEKRRWEWMRENVEFYLLENVRSYLRITKRTHCRLQCVLYS